MAVSGYSPRSLGGIALPRGPRTYKVCFKVWGYVKVEADNVEDAESILSDMTVKALLDQGTAAAVDFDEPEEVE